MAHRNLKLLTLLQSNLMQNNTNYLLYVIHWKFIFTSRAPPFADETIKTLKCSNSLHLSKCSNYNIVILCSTEKVDHLVKEHFVLINLIYIHSHDNKQ